MPRVRRLWIGFFSAGLVAAVVLFWPFGEGVPRIGGTGLNETRWARPSSPTFKERRQETIPYDAEAETAASVAAAQMAAKELEKEEDVPEHIRALTDGTLTDEQVRAKLRVAVLSPELSLEERAEALGHLHNLSTGSEVDQLLPVAQDPALAPDLLAEMLDVSLNRDFFYQADIALGVLEKRQEPELIEAARRQLVFLAGADHGLDVGRWRAALAQVSGSWVRETVVTE